jgi:hypothetical protein
VSAVAATTAHTPAEHTIHGYLTSLDALRRQMTPVGLPDVAYHGIEDFFLRHGRFYRSEPLTAAEKDYLRRILRLSGRKYPVKQCFYNSQMLLLITATWMDPEDGMDLRYVEGYAVGLIPIHHGWLTLNGKVIDPTLRLRELPTTGPLAKRVKGTFPETAAYFGVPFRTEEVRASVLERGEGGSLLMDPKRDFPFLRAPYTVTP